MLNDPHVPLNIQEHWKPWNAALDRQAQHMLELRQTCAVLNGVQTRDTEVVLQQDPEDWTKVYLVARVRNQHAE